MKSGIRVEPAHKTDIPALIELLALLFSIERDFCPDPEKQRRGLECLLEKPENGVIFVARDREGGGGVIGMVSAQLVISTASGAPSAWIEDVVLRPEYRKMGIGRQLIDAAIAWAGQKGARRLQLLADADNTPALAFYERLDWQPTRLFAWRIFV